MSLAIAGLRFSYGKRARPVLDGIDIAPLERGRFVALVGPNGVGKTTLFRVIAGLLPAHDGSLSLDGEDFAAMPKRRRQDRVFHLSQNHATRSALTVFDLVLLALKTGGGWRATPADLRAVEATIADTGLTELADRMLPELSGGQQQLVGLAQALVRRPDVLLLDEPTSALDLRRQLEVMGLIRRITADRGMITLAAIHDLTLAARFAERLLLLDRGMIAADGNADEVLGSPALAAAYGVSIHLERTSRGLLAIEPQLPV